MFCGGNEMNRVGNKRRIASEIIKFMPPHDIYIEPFFGGGGMFFSKPRAKYNLVNDIDKELINYFIVRMTKNEEFIKLANELPIAKEFWKLEATDMVLKAVLYWQKYTCSLYGAGRVLTPSTSEKKESYNFENTKMFSRDYIEFIGIFKPTKNKFIYADPPYINSDSRYGKIKYDELIEVVTPFKTMVSSYSNMKDYFEQKGFRYIPIKELQTMKNRNIECIYINYELDVYQEELAKEKLSTIQI